MTKHVFLVIDEPLRQGVVKLNVTNETVSRFYVEQTNVEIITGNFTKFTSKTFVPSSKEVFLSKAFAIERHLKFLGKSKLSVQEKIALKEKAQRIMREL